MISVLIFTRNEELDLHGCLASVSWSDDIHVFDSFSTDQTVNIAARFRAQVHQRRFDNFASQKNAGLHSVSFRHDWVLILDADERVTQPLSEEMAQFVLEATRNVSAARLRRRDFFAGTWLKHAQLSPFYIRLVRPRNVHYERDVNEVLKVEGEVFDLNERFDHFPFSKGIRHWLDKHNVYSTMEARIALVRKGSGPPYSLKGAIFAKDFNQRRYHQKGLFLKLPCRPLIKFAYLMLWRRAFLDGRPGITYALLQSIYEYFIILKQRESIAQEACCSGSPQPITAQGQSEQLPSTHVLAEGVGRGT